MGKLHSLDINRRERLLQLPNPCRYRNWCAVLGCLFAMLFVRNVTGGQTKLAWDPVNDTRISVYQVWYRTISGQYDQHLETTSNPVVVSGLTDGQTYFFKVRACDASRVLCSGFSNEVSETLPDPSVEPPQTASDDDAPTPLDQVSIPYLLPLVGFGFWLLILIALRHRKRQL